MLYLLIIPALIIMVSCIFTLWKIKKHDTILFSYAQLRRNILLYLKEEGLKINDPDYKIVNELLDRVDKTIHRFSDFKTTYFNIRKLKKLAKNIKDEEKRTDYALKKTSNKEIIILQKNYNCLVVKSCFAYTPFFRSEIILSLIFYIAKLLVKAGVEKSKKISNDLDWLQSKRNWLDRPENQYNVFAL